MELRAEPRNLLVEYASTNFDHPATSNTTKLVQEEHEDEHTTRITSTSEIRSLIQTGIICFVLVSLCFFSDKLLSVQAKIDIKDVISDNKVDERKRRCEVLENNVESSSGNEHTESCTLKVSTQNMKEIFDAIPKEIIPETQTNSSNSAKRRKVSFVSSSSRKASSEHANDSENIFLQKEKYFSLNGKTFFKLSTIGKGGSSSVFKVISPKDGSIYALKTVDLSKQAGNNDDDEIEQVFESYTNEISLLNKLKNSSSFIIDLVDHQIFQEEKKIAMLLELGDVDLAKLLNQSIKRSPGNMQSSTSFALDPIFIRMVWKEMLLAVQHIHENRIVHGTISFLLL